MIYLLNYLQSQDVDQVETTISGMHNQATLQGLSGHVNYTLTVWASNSAGNSDGCEPVSFTTPISGMAKALACIASAIVCV